MGNILPTQETQDKISPIKGRLLEYAKVKGITKRELSNSLSISYENLKPNSLSSELGGDIIGRILPAYPDLSPRWLLTGEGEMLINDIQELYYPKCPDPIHIEQRIPLYDIQATAGFSELLDNKDEHVIDMIEIPRMTKCDGAITVVGDSMDPIIKSGDIILYKTVRELSNIFYGEMYIISLSVEDEEYITIKYIIRSEIDDNHLRLESFNPKHSPKEILKSSIRAIALVKASIRYHSML